MSTGFPFDVFLSHNTADKPRVRRLAERLKQAGLRVWFDEWNVRSGDIIALKVDEGLEQSRVLLLCISPKALASDWVALERNTAIHRDPANEGRRFIPLLLADCALPDTLRRYKYVDFRKEADAAFAEVLAVCRPEAAEMPPVTKRAPKKAGKPKAKRPKKAEPLAVLERKLTGHKGSVKSVAVSPDGTWAASGSDDNTVKIWDLETGECRATLSDYVSSELGNLSITEDGKCLLFPKVGNAIHVWDAENEQLLQVLRGHAGQVTRLEALSDGLRALSVSVDKTIRIWNVASGECVTTSEMDRGSAEYAAISRDGRWVVSAAMDRDNLPLEVWDAVSGKHHVSLVGHQGWAKPCAFTQDTKHLLSGSQDSTLKIWNLQKATCLGTLEGHRGMVDFAAASDAFIAVGSWNEGVWIWDRRTDARIQLLADGYGKEKWGFESVVFSSDGQRLIAGNNKGEVHIFRLSIIAPDPTAEVTRRYLNAKVVLLGEGTVGKTSLAHRLVEDKYVVRDRTHGMNVWRLDLPPVNLGSSGRESAHSPSSDKDQNRLTSAATEDREALLWDLAGQEDYRLIHPLFLQETALALLLVNPQTANPFRETGDWLKMLKSAANEQDHKREADRLLILSQVDVGGPKLSDAKLDQFCQANGFNGWLPTSAKTGENCSDKENGSLPSKLKQLIAGSIPWDKLPWTSTPRLLAELKNAVMAMRDKSDIRLLRFSELTQRLEQALAGEKFGESDVRTAVTLLANHGLARPLKFGDLVLLQPELLNGYAAAIIRAARAHTDEIGCVLEADIYKPDFDFTGVERLKHRPDEELLLRALVQTFLDHSLCIAEDTPHGRHLVFPSQYRREKDIPRDPDIFISYTFSGEWQTVWTTLVVRLWYSQEFKHRELWRNAAEFASPKGYTLGLKIDNQQGEGTAKISFYFDKDVQDELKSLFIEYGHRHLARYATEVSRDRRYVCPECGKPVKDFEAVRKRLDAKKEFITCQECDEKVPLIDFIEQRLKSDPVARKILAMDEITTRELDTQALEQILIGHVMAIAGEANQIFRPVTMFDHGIDGEVEFKDNDGKPSGKKVYVQFRSENYYLRKWSHRRNADGFEVLDGKDDHLEYWISQPVDVYLVLRQTDETSSGQVIRWMNVTRYLKAQKDKQRRQIIFQGEKLDMEAVWKVRDQFFPPTQARGGKV